MAEEGIQPFRGTSGAKEIVELFLELAGDVDMMLAFAKSAGIDWSRLAIHYRAIMQTLMQEMRTAELAFRAHYCLDPEGDCKLFDLARAQRDMAQFKAGMQ